MIWLLLPSELHDNIFNNFNKFSRYIIIFLNVKCCTHRFVDSLLKDLECALVKKCASERFWIYMANRPRLARHHARFLLLDYILSMNLSMSISATYIALNWWYLRTFVLLKIIPPMTYSFENWTKVKGRCTQFEMAVHHTDGCFPATNMVLTSIELWHILYSPDPPARSADRLKFLKLRRRPAKLINRFWLISKVN